MHKYKPGAIVGYVGLNQCGKEVHAYQLFEAGSILKVQCASSDVLDCLLLFGAVHPASEDREWGPTFRLTPDYDVVEKLEQQTCTNTNQET